MDDDVHHIFVFLFSPTANALNTFLLWQYIVDAEATLVVASKYLLTGAHLVDFLPFRMSIQLQTYPFVFFLLTRCVYPVKHIPKWAPFAGFHREADAAREPVDRMFNRPYSHVKKEMVGFTLMHSNFRKTCFRLKGMLRLRSFTIFCRTLIRSVM